MKVTVTKPVEIEPRSILVKVPVPYGTEDIPEDAPGRKGDTWAACVDVDTGRIRHWRGGAIDVRMKVVDQGVYTLYDADGDQLAKIDRDYVPCCIPGEYGDYIDFSIGADGQVAGWAKFCTPQRIAESFFPKED